MSDSLFFHERSHIDVYEYSPVYDDLAPPVPWTNKFSPTLKSKELTESIPYHHVNPRRKRWSYGSGMSTDSSVSASSSPTVSCPSPRSKRRSSIVYKQSDAAGDKMRKARSSIVYKKAPTDLIPDAPIPPPEPSAARYSFFAVQKRNPLSAVAVAAWAWTVGAVVSRRKMSTRRRCLQLKALQLPSQHCQSLVQRRASVCWQIVTSHLDKRKPAPPAARLKPLVLPSMQQNVPKDRLTAWLERLLSDLVERGTQAVVALIRTLWLSICMTNEYFFRFPKFLFTLISYVVIACFERILPPRLL